MFKRLKRALRAFLRDPRHNHEFNKEDKERSEIIRELRKEMRDTTNLLLMKKEYLDLQAEIKNLSGNKNSVENKFFEKAMEIIGSKIEQKILDKKPSSDQATPAILQTLSDEEFNTKVIPILQKIPKEKMEDLRRLAADNPAGLNQEIKVGCNNYSIDPTEDQIKKIIEVIING